MHTSATDRAPAPEATADLIVLRDGRIVAHHACADAVHRLRTALRLLEESPRLLKTKIFDDSATRTADQMRRNAVHDVCTLDDPRIEAQPDRLFHELSKVCAGWGVQLAISDPIRETTGWTLFGRWDEDQLVIDHAVRGRHNDEMPTEPVTSEGQNQPWCDYVDLEDLDDAVAAAVQQYDPLEPAHV